MEQQEYIMKINLLGQEAEKIEQQIQMIDQQINELGSVRESLEALKEKSKNRKEILTNLGKGIFVKTEIKEEGLYINVGKEIVLKKNPVEVIGIIEEQFKRLEAGKSQFIEKIQELQEEMQNLLLEMQKEHGSQGHSKHGCDNEGCECEEPCEDCECDRH